VAARGARAAERKRQRIGFLGTSSPSLERHLVDAFRERLRELGHVEGQNVAIEYRWAGFGRIDRTERR
jgi:putative tryptophan/tyrosine transport system substrate-binding protein